MTYSMSTAAARKASKKTQHVRSTGDWITLVLLIVAAIAIFFLIMSCALFVSHRRKK